MSEAARDEMPSESLSVRLFVMLLANVISRPSSTHATPSAVSTRVWNLDQGSRSMRAGIRVEIEPWCSVAVCVVAIATPGKDPLRKC